MAIVNNIIREFMNIIVWIVKKLYVGNVLQLMIMYQENNIKFVIQDKFMIRKLKKLKKETMIQKARNILLRNKCNY